MDKARQFVERQNQELKEEVTYYVGLLGQFKDEEAIYEDIPTDLEEQRTDQYHSENSSDVFVGPTVRLQRDFYERYREHKELSQHVWEGMHTTFPIASTSAIVRQLPTEVDRKFLSHASSD